MATSASDLRALMVGAASRLPTGAVSRVLRMGRGAAGVGTALLADRLRGRDGGFDTLDATSIARLVRQLGELRGIGMKVGQVLGYVDPTLSPEIRELLALLQTASPPSPREDVERTIRQSLGPKAELLLAGLDPSPIAVASIGQVHRGVLLDGRTVAVKVRHHGIVEAMHADFRAAAAGPVLARLFAGAAGASVAGMVEEARTTFLEECDFTLEAERQRTFAKHFAGDPDIHVPAVIGEWCGPAVLVTEWCAGTGLEAWLGGDPGQDARDRVGVALFRFAFRTLYRDGLFNADPHPGNVAVLPDGSLVAYDYGCVRRFDLPDRLAFARLSEAVRVDDDDAADEALRALGARFETDDDARQVRRTLLRSFFGPLLVPGVRAIPPDGGFTLGQALHDKRALMQLQLPGKLLFLFRLRFGLYAILARIGARADWAAQERAWAAAAA